MSLIYFADKHLIAPGANDPRVTLRMGILHVDGGNARSLANWFDGPSGGIESHVHVPKEENVEQYRDTAFEADANYLANPFAFSVETQGFADGEWNDLQMRNIKRLMIWGNLHHNIPLIKPTRWDGKGWGYHTMFPEWHPKAKECPGKDRIAQYHDELVPWMENAKVAIEDTILNSAERGRLAANLTHEMLKEILTPAQKKRAQERHEDYVKSNPVRKG